VINSIIGSYTYYGCKTKANNARALSASVSYNYTSIILEMCASMCQSTFWGVEYWGECYCGDFLYGEGEKAFYLLQLEIIKNSSDESIFEWGWKRAVELPSKRMNGIIAGARTYPRHYGDIVSETPFRRPDQKRFTDTVEATILPAREPPIKFPTRGP